jgi:hypothetical protein
MMDSPAVRDIKALNTDTKTLQAYVKIMTKIAAVISGLGRDVSSAYITPPRTLIASDHRRFHLEITFADFNA